jgi:hypothetical protein
MCVPLARRLLAQRHGDGWHETRIGGVHVARRKSKRAFPRSGEIRRTLLSNTEPHESGLLVIAASGLDLPGSL